MAYFVSSATPIIIFRLRIRYWVYFENYLLLFLEYLPSLLCDFLFSQSVIKKIFISLGLLAQRYRVFKYLMGSETSHTH